MKTRIAAFAAMALMLVIPAAAAFTGTYGESNDCRASLSEAVIAINEWGQGNKTVGETVALLNEWNKKPNDTSCCMHDYDRNADHFIDQSELLGGLFSYAATVKCQKAGTCSGRTTSLGCLERIMYQYKNTCKLGVFACHKL